MPQSPDLNRRITLASRPMGPATTACFALEDTALPTPGAGEMLLRAEYLSLDPYMRGRMNDMKSYAPPTAIGEVMPGQVVAEVMASDCAGFAPGDRVLAMSGWQDYAVSDGEGVFSLGPAPDRPSWALGVLGMPGFTAHAGLMEIGAPKAGETLVVAAATGPVGATVGQIGKILGLRVVGVAGGAAKCTHAVEVLGFDACLDHQADDFETQLAAACPQGVDIYWENVGGRVLYAVLPLLNPFARIPLCGIVGWSNLSALPDGPDRGVQILSTLLRMKVKMQGFIVYDSFGRDHHAAFRADMTRWLDEGRIQYREHLVEGGLEAAPQAFLDMLEGRNFGKTVVRLG